MVYSECVTDRTPFLEITYPEMERIGKKPKFKIFHLNKRNPERELFIKSFNEKEFVGDEVCRRIGRSSANYFLVGVNPNTTARYRCGNYYGDVKDKNYSFYIGSYDFRDPDKEYFDLESFNLGDNPIETILNMCPNAENKNELLHEILELSALDVFMGQEDRCSKNVMIEKDKNGILHIAPIYDFQYSLKRSSLYYENDFMKLRSDRDYNEIMDRYSEFKDLLEYFSYEDLYMITEAAFSRHSMYIPEGQKDYLKDYSKSRRQLIKKILK